MNEMELLRSLTPAEDDSERAEALGRERLQAAIAAEVENAGSVLGSVRSWWATRRPVVPGIPVRALAAVVVAILAIVVATQVLSRAPAVAGLAQLAEIAESVAPPQAGVGEFLYSRSEVTELRQESGPDGTLSFASRGVVENWLGSDGSLVTRTTRLEPEFFDDVARGTFTALGLESVYGEGVDTQFFAAEESPVDYREWPTDPAVLDPFLRNLVASESEIPELDRLLERAAVVLRTAPSGELRAAVLRVLDGLEGTEEHEVGVGGAALVTVATEYMISDGTFRRELVFDADSAQLLEDSLVLIGDSPTGIPTGTPYRLARHDPAGLVQGLPAGPP